MKIATAVMLLVLGSETAYGQRQAETLDRGVVAIRYDEEQVFVCWRLLANDSHDTAFNVYRAAGAGAPVGLNSEPLVGPTHFTDEQVDLSQATRYFVHTVGAGGREDKAGRAFELAANAPVRPYLPISLRTPAGY